MTRRGRGIGAVLVVTLVFGFSACDNDSGSDPEASRPATAAQFFFSQRAASGTLGDGRVSLDDVSQSILAVSVRPLRAEQRIPVGEFTSGWDERFADDQPNAVLSVVVDGEEREVALVVSDPRYDAMAAHVDYAVDALGDEPLPTWTFTEATLFIDSAPADPYIVEVTPGASPGQPALERELTMVANERVVVITGREQGSLELSVMECECDGYLEVANDADEEIQVEVLQGGVPVASSVIRSNGEWFWRP